MKLHDTFISSQTRKAKQKQHAHYTIKFFALLVMLQKTILALMRKTSWENREKILVRITVDLCGTVAPRNVAYKKGTVSLTVFLLFL